MEMAISGSFEPLIKFVLTEMGEIPLNDMAKNLLLWMVIAAVLLTVFNNINQETSSVSVTYSDFVK